jgi:very-short-patch-repair endonuclease
LARRLRAEQTPHEAMLWERLRRSQLAGFHFRRQQIIDGFIVDFYCHAAGLVIEIDGSVHEAQLQYDEERSRILVDRGLMIIRFTNDEVESEIEDVLARIIDYTTARARRSSSPFPQGDSALPSP